MKARLRSCTLAARALWRELNSKSVMGACNRIDLSPQRLARIVGAGVEEVMAAAEELVNSGLARGRVTAEAVELSWDQGPLGPPAQEQSPGGVPDADVAAAAVAPLTPVVELGRDPLPPREPRPDGSNREAGVRRRGAARGGEERGRGDGGTVPMRGAPQKRTKNNKKKRPLSSCSSSSGSVPAHGAAPQSGVCPAGSGPALPPGPFWTPETGWQAVEGDDLRRWETAFPEIDVSRHLARMDVWLRANPGKARRNDWAHFIVNWLKREVNTAPAVPPPVGAAAGTSTAAAQPSTPASVRRAAERAGEFPEPSFPAGVVFSGRTGAGNTNIEGANHAEAAAA